MSLLSNAEPVVAVKRVSRRTAKLVHQEMNRGRSSLATIASTAPLVGLFGTVLGIVNSFPGCAGSQAFYMSVTAERLSEALVPTALGLLVAVPAWWCYRYLSSQIEAFDLQTTNASIMLVNYLTIYSRGRREWSTRR